MIKEYIEQSTPNDVGSWRTHRLGDLLLEKPSYGANASATDYTEGVTPRYVRITDIISQTRLDEASAVGIEPSLAAGSILENGDVLIARTGNTVGKSFFYRHDHGHCAYAGYLIRFVLDTNKCQLEFLRQILDSPQYWKWVRDIARTGAQPNINSQEYQSFLIALPPAKIQKKIAEILTCWDKAIELVERLIEEKRVRKIALTLKLITGRLRLPKHVKDSSYATTRYGAFPRDWRAIKVKDVAEESKLRFDADNNTTVLSCTKHNGLVPSLEYFGKQIFSNDLSNYKVVTLNQFAYATNHIEEGSIGLLTTIKRGLVSPIYTVFQTNIEVDPRFLFAVFKTSLYLHIFQSATSASVDRRGSLRWSEFKEIPLWLPSLPEQRDISQLIALLDTELESLQRYATALND